MTESTDDDAASHVQPALENDQQQDRAEKMENLTDELEDTDQIADALTERMSGE
jgi:hypothetical protein